MDNQSATDTPAEMPTAQEIKIIVYVVECPSCSEWLESDHSIAGEVDQCICGTKFKVVR